MMTSTINNPGLRVAGIGEILMDRFEGGTATLGGAPFNLTFHLHQLLTALQLGEAVYVSAVGEDAPGAEIVEQVRRAGMTTSYLAVDQTHATGSAMVLEKSGEAGFEILQDVAWDYLEASHATDTLAKTSQAVVFGSLAQRDVTSRKTIQEFVAHVQGPRFYDVNLRRNTTDGVAGYSRQIFAESLELASILKMNDAELEEVAALLEITSSISNKDERLWDLMAQFLIWFQLSAITVTRGGLGALLLEANGKRHKLADSKMRPEDVHPVGGGDSFAAGLLFGVVQGWAMEDCLKCAEMLSSFVVLDRTATPNLTPEIVARIKALAANASPGATA